jgi:hypothetical protein
MPPGAVASASEDLGTRFRVGLESEGNTERTAKYVPVRTIRALIIYVEILG